MHCEQKICACCPRTDRERGTSGGAISGRVTRALVNSDPAWRVCGRWRAESIRGAARTHAAECAPFHADYNAARPQGADGGGGGGEAPAARAASAAVALAAGPPRSGGTSGAQVAAGLAQSVRVGMMRELDTVSPVVWPAWCYSGQQHPRNLLPRHHHPLYCLRGFMQICIWPSLLIL